LPSTIGRALPALTGALILALAACGSGGSAPGKGPAGAGARDVGYVVLQPQDVPLETELPGRASAWRLSEVRPQISGVIRRQLFIEGAEVRPGQPLYEIDPLPYRAALAEAEANLQSALASAEAARTTADRLRPLAEIEAVSRQDYTNALAAARQAEAAVAQRRAARDRARLDLGYTAVPAPIGGRIGRSAVTVGALVTANQAAPLAQISQLDPIYVDIQQSAADLLALRRQVAGGGGALPDAAEVRLVLEDGSDYDLAGRVRFTEAIVDPATGTVTLRAQLPNPRSWLLPGMFVRARFSQAVERGAFLVPQQAVTRDNKGAAQLYLVGKDSKAELRDVAASRTHGSFWVVTRGLRPGDRVIVEGTGNLRPGQMLKAAALPRPVVPTAPPARPASGP
jgi:membrane fusion protein (multidrug efflux system)